MFFKAKELVVLDVGSRVLSAVVALKKNRDIFYVKAFSESLYSGYEDGKWFDTDELKECAREVLAQALARGGARPKTLYVSAPAEFATTTMRDVAVMLDRPRRVVDADIDYLFKKGDTFESNSLFMPVNTSAVYYTCDDASRKLVDPRGIVARKVAARATYVSVERAFAEIFDSIASSAGFSEVEYISSEWAQGLTLLEREQRDRDCLLLNIGYLSSSVSLIKGEGLLDLKSFSLGGAHIAAKIFEAFDAPFDIALEVRDMVDLNLSYAPDDYITASDGSGFLCAEVVTVIKDGLDLLISTIANAVELIGYDLSSYSPVYLTGDGVTGIRGAVKYIGEALGNEIDVLSPRLPAYNKPHYSSAVALVSIASKLTNTRRQSLLRA